MRRLFLVSACLGILAVGGASTALAAGPHRGHGPPVVRHGYPPRGGSWHTGYRGHQPHCLPGRRVAAYPVYPAYPAYPATAFGFNYPQLGFGVAGRNFSFWLQR